MTEINLKIACEGDVKTIVEALRADHVEWLADSIEEQVKPAIEEPSEPGSLVRAGVDGLSDRVLWMRTRKGGWISEEALLVPDFTFLHHPEVLRVGIGDGRPRPVEELVGVLSDPNWKPPTFCSLRQDCRMADGHDGGCQP